MMRRMTEQHVKTDFSGIQKRHRMEIAEAVARYCIANKISDIAEWLGYSPKWVQTQLDYAGMNEALGGAGNLTPLSGSSGNTEKEATQVLRKFAPSVEIKTKDDGKGNRTITEITGRDADEFEPYVDHYLRQGHEADAAVRLAKAEYATEEAVEAGVIKESINKRNEKVNSILFPNAQTDNFELDLEMHMARVKAAARFLDEAKVPYLRRKSTCKKVAKANGMWSEQMDRILNLHPTVGGSE